MKTVWRKMGQNIASTFLNAFTGLMEVSPHSLVFVADMQQILLNVASVLTRYSNSAALRTPPCCDEPSPSAAMFLPFSVDFFGPIAKKEEGEGARGDDAHRRFSLLGS